LGAASWTRTRSSGKWPTDGCRRRRALKSVGRVVLRGKEISQLSGELLQNDKIVATATATA